MARITVEDCINKFESRFELVLIASNRARKLHSGEDAMVDRDNDKNTVIALREIADDNANIDELKNSLIEEYQTVSVNNDEELSLEYSEYENEDQDAQGEDLENEEEIISESKEDKSDIEYKTEDKSDIEYKTEDKSEIEYNNENPKEDLN